jgi:methylmalonyl-CoA mutase
MAGVLGGCNALEIYAFDATNPDEKHPEFGTHLARNQQLIFKEEGYLHKVADVGSGSFFIEKRTEELAMEGWKRFQETETKGGLMVSFEDGWLREQIDQQAQQLIQQYKEGNRILIGVNKYLNPREEKNSFSKEPLNKKGIRKINIAKEIL